MAQSHINCFKCHRKINLDTAMFQDSIKKRLDCPFCGIDIFVKMTLVFGPSPEHIKAFEDEVASYINFKSYGYVLEPKVKEFIDNLIKGTDDEKEDKENP